MTLPDAEAARYATPSWLESIRDEIAAIVDPDIEGPIDSRAVVDAVEKLVGALRHERSKHVTGETSDGYHTFNELYDHRITLFIAFCAEVDARTPTGYVWRSKLHSDGSMFDGWFVMGIGDRAGEQVTYHLPMSRWSETDWLGTERPRAPEFDGHTSSDVIARLQRFYDYSPAPAVEILGKEHDDVEF